jgi:hypothetical protein
VEKIWNEWSWHNRDAVHTFAWRNWRKPPEIFVKISGVSTEIRTKNLPYVSMRPGARKMAPQTLGRKRGNKFRSGPMGMLNNNVKIEACSPKTLISTYKSTRCQNLGDHNLSNHRSENLRSYISLLIPPSSLERDREMNMTGNFLNCTLQPQFLTWRTK